MILREYVAIVFLLWFCGGGLLVTAIILHVKGKVDRRQRPDWSPSGAPQRFEVVVKPPSSTNPDDDPG